MDYIILLLYNVIYGLYTHYMDYVVYIKIYTLSMSS